MQKGENEEEKKEDYKMEGGNLEIDEGKVPKWGEDFFFFLAFHFSKQWKFVLGVPKWKFSTGKKEFTPGKKIWKNDIPPSEKIPVTPLTHTLSHMYIPSKISTYINTQNLNTLNLHEQWRGKLEIVGGGFCRLFFMNVTFTKAHFLGWVSWYLQ